MSTNSHLPCSHYYIVSSPFFLSIRPNNLFFHSLTYVCHTCPCSYFFRPHLLNPLHSHHPSWNILISLLSSNSCPAFLTLHVSLIGFRTILIVVLYTATLVTKHQIQYILFSIVKYTWCIRFVNLSVTPDRIDSNYLRPCAGRWYPWNGYVGNLSATESGGKT